MVPYRAGRLGCLGYPQQSAAYLIGNDPRGMEYISGPGYILTLQKTAEILILRMNYDLAS